jgi:hypothetical protein
MRHDQGVRAHESVTSVLFHYDGMIALRWAIKKAKEYNIDTDRIVFTGHGRAALIFDHRDAAGKGPASITIVMGKKN